MRLHSGKRCENKQSCEDIVTAVVSWSVFKCFMFVCEISINEESVILCIITTINQSGSCPSVYSLGWSHAFRRVYKVL